MLLKKLDAINIQDQGFVNRRYSNFSPYQQRGQFHPQGRGNSYPRGHFRGQGGSHDGDGKMHG